MRSTFRSFIAIAFLAVGSSVLAQESSEAQPPPVPVVEPTPAPVVEVESAEPPAPEDSSAPEVAPLPAEGAPAETTMPEAVPAPEPIVAPETPATTLAPIIAPQKSAPEQPPAVVAPRKAKPSKAPKVLDTRIETRIEPEETEKPLAGPVQAEAGSPPPEGPSPLAAESAVPPVPIADVPVSAPAVEERTVAETSSKASLWPLLGGLALGVGWIIVVLSRRRRTETVSIAGL